LVRTLARLDASWLFLIAGTALIAATLLIAAADDLAEANHQRRRALAAEAAHQERLERHAAFLDAVDRGEESVVRTLAATQLRMTASGREPLALAGPTRVDASVFPGLEPPPMAAPSVRLRPDSLLGRLATGERSRLWLLAAGASMVFIGLLPRSVNPGS
jgi:hypothetical protein